MTLSAADAPAGAGAGCDARRVVLRRALTDLIDDAIASPAEAGPDPMDELACDPAALLLDLLVEWGVVEMGGGSGRGDRVQREPLPSHLMSPGTRPRLIHGTKPA